MGKTLKTIKIVFTVDVERFRRNIKAAEAAVDSAGKKIEEANKGIVDANEKVAQSSEHFAEANGQAAEANQKLAKSSGLLAKSLGVLKGSLAVVGSALTVTTSTLLATTGLFIKFFPLVQKTRESLHTFAGAVERTTIKLSMLYSDGLLAVARGLQVLGPRFPALQRGIAATTGVVSKLALGLSGASFAVGRFLKNLGPVQATMRQTSISADKVATRVGIMTAGFLSSSRPVGILVKSLRSVGVASVPLLNKLLSISALLPTLGFAVTWFAGKAIAKLVGWLKKAAAAALEFARETAQTADALAKTGTKLGIQVETLQQYQFAANLAGVKTEALNVGIQRFLRRTAEARQGTGVLKKEFDKLGIALVDSYGYVRSGTEVFEDYLRAISETKDKQEQLRLAFAAFDTEGVALVNLAKQGSEEFARQREEAERLGIVLSGELLKGYEEVNDQLATNAKRVEAARLKNSLFLAQMAVKWDSFKTSIKVATLELLAFMRPLEARTEFGLTQKLKETEQAIERTTKALDSSVANLPLVTGVLEVFLGGLIEDQERILAAIEKARGEEIQVAVERPEDITRQIEEQIASQERRLEQQQRLTEAAKEGEEAHLRVTNAIAAENAARALGINATEAEREQVTQTTLALLESQQAMEASIASTKDLAAGEELRLATLERLQGQTRQTNSTLLSSVQTLLFMRGATEKAHNEFDRLSKELLDSTAALAKLERELKKGAGEGENAKKKFAQLSKEADKLRKSIDKSRKGLEKMEQGLQTTGDMAGVAGNAMLGLGNNFSRASQGVDDFNRSLEENRRGLEEVADAANDTADSVAGIARETRNLGAVVAGDVNDPANIQRALNNLNALMRQASFSTGAAGRIQQRILRAEIDRLEEDLRLANEQARKEIIDGIIRANEELTGDALEEAVAEEIALRQRYGILPASGSSKPAFQGVQAGRW